MPILTSEPMIFPVNLLDEPALADSPAVNGALASRWFVAHTKPRQEKALARYLLSRQIPYFAPQYARYQSDHRGHATSWIPLFSGYVFVKADDSGRIEALQSHRIAAPLPVTDQARLVDDLRRVKRIIDAKLPLYPEERLAPGERVRIVLGPLQGLEGIVESRLGRCRFVVSVDFIRQGVSVEVDARVLEPLRAGAEPERAVSLGASDHRGDRPTRV